MSKHPDTESQTTPLKASASNFVLLWTVCPLDHTDLASYKIPGLVPKYKEHPGRYSFGKLNTRCWHTIQTLSHKTRQRKHLGLTPLPVEHVHPSIATRTGFNFLTSFGTSSTLFTGTTHQFSPTQLVCWWLSA